MNIFIHDKIIEGKFTKFHFISVCIQLVALRMNLYHEVALSFKKVGDPCSSVCDVILSSMTSF